MDHSDSPRGDGVPVVAGLPRLVSAVLGGAPFRRAVGEGAPATALGVACQGRAVAAGGGAAAAGVVGASAGAATKSRTAAPTRVWAADCGRASPGSAGARILRSRAQTSRSDGARQEQPAPQATTASTRRVRVPSSRLVKAVSTCPRGDAGGDRGGADGDQERRGCRPGRRATVAAVASSPTRRVRSVVTVRLLRRRGPSGLGVPGDGEGGDADDAQERGGVGVGGGDGHGGAAGDRDGAGHLR